MIEQKPDVIIIGAGAAGLFCAGLLSKKKIHCLLLESNKTAGKKIIISGGGRCNFTNLDVQKQHFSGESKNFHWNILRQYSNDQFIELVKKHHISYYEKKLGQLFCKESSKEILNMLISEIDTKYVKIMYQQQVIQIDSINKEFQVTTANKSYNSHQVVIASGGLPMPAIGGSDFGLTTARKFNIGLSSPEEALVPISDKKYNALSGISLPVSIKIDKQISIKDDLLFTHKGLSGPAILKATLYKNTGSSFTINLLPKYKIEDLIEHKKKHLKNVLAQYFPDKLSDFILNKTGVRSLAMNELSKKEIAKLNEFIFNHHVNYTSNEGYRKAEVMKGGVLTKELTRGCESRKVPNLYFIGETVDVTGLLGGYNFQWAWSSAYVCANSIEATTD